MPMWRYGRLARRVAVATARIDFANNGNANKRGDRESLSSHYSPCTFNDGISRVMAAGNDAIGSRIAPDGAPSSPEEPRRLALRRISAGSARNYSLENELSLLFLFFFSSVRAMIVAVRVSSRSIGFALRKTITLSFGRSATYLLIQGVRKLRV